MQSDPTKNDPAPRHDSELDGQTVARIADDVASEVASDGASGLTISEPNPAIEDSQTITQGLESASAEPLQLAKSPDDGSAELVVTNLSSPPEPPPIALQKSSSLSDDGDRYSKHRDANPRQLAYSTLLSLLVVLVLLVAVRLIVPSLVESVRYGWYRGQLRAEYEMSGERLRHVSLDSLADVSQLVSKRVGPSVVHINLLQSGDEAVAVRNQLQKFLLPQQATRQVVEGQGSGFVVDKSGYILTNHHVIDGVGRIEVTTSDGRRLDAFVVGMDPPTDLALLKVDASDLMPIAWGDSEQIVVGSPVWAVGSPFGLQQTVTFGIVSGKHRVDLRGTRYESTVRASTAYGDLMQSDVALNPGNSGGPLVNSMGDVIGVNAAILGETYRGISFSIPSKVAQRVAQQLIADGEVARGWLGVAMRELEDDMRFDKEGRMQPGVIVNGFAGDGDSPAREAGLEIGDIILSFDGQQVKNQVDLMRLIGEADAGATVPIEIRRGEETLALQVKLGRRPAGLTPK